MLTNPLLVTNQDKFLNAAAVFSSKRKPKEILSLLQRIEKRMGKSPPIRYGPRTIDLDIIFYGKDIILEEDLIIPHTDMHLRRFVLEPVIELLGKEYAHPCLDLPLGHFIKKVNRQRCKKTSIIL